MQKIEAINKKEVSEETSFLYQKYNYAFRFLMATSPAAMRSVRITRIVDSGHVLTVVIFFGSGVGVG